MDTYILYFDNRTAVGAPLFAVELEFADKLPNLKRKIEQCQGIPIGQQNLLQNLLQLQPKYLEDDAVPVIDLVTVPNSFLCITAAAMKTLEPEPPQDVAASMELHREEVETGVDARAWITGVIPKPKSIDQADKTFEKEWPSEIKSSMQIMDKFDINCAMPIPRGVENKEIGVNVVISRPGLSPGAVQLSEIGVKARRRLNLPAVLVRVKTFHSVILLRKELDKLRDRLKSFPVPQIYSLFHVNNDDRLSPYTHITEHATFSDLEIKDQDVVLVCDLPAASQRIDWVVIARHLKGNAIGGAQEVVVEIEPWKTVGSLKNILVNHPSKFQTPDPQKYMLLHRGKLMREEESFLWHGVSFADHIYVVPVAMGPDQGDKED